MEKTNEVSTEEMSKRYLEGELMDGVKGAILGTSISTCIIGATCLIRGCSKKETVSKISKGTVGGLAAGLGVAVLNVLVKSLIH